MPPAQETPNGAVPQNGDRHNRVNMKALHHNQSSTSPADNNRGNVARSNHHHHQSEQNETATVPRPVAGAQPTPLFERLVTEEVQELKAYVRIVENQNRRLEELERVHGDLEGRLESESKRRQQLEVTLEAREGEWNEKFENLEKDRDHWKQVVEAEKTKNSRLIDQVVRKDQDIHRMLQRKYDHEAGRSVRNVRHAVQEQGAKPPGIPASASNSKSPEIRNDAAHKGPHEILAATGSAEKVRVRNAGSLLMDFFGM